MIIYNVTVKIEHDIQSEWLQWMKEIHVPEVLATGLFIENKIWRVLVDESDGITYSIQYTCKNIEDFQQYQAEFAPSLQQKHIEKYQGKFVAFRTLLEQV